MFELFVAGKARRLKQAKDEATEEIEKYRQERDKQFKEFEAKVSIETKPIALSVFFFGFN